LRKSVRVATPIIQATPTTKRNKPKGHSRSWDESASNTKTSPITTKTSARITCIRFTGAMYTHTPPRSPTARAAPAAASSGNVRGLQWINQHPGSAVARSLRCVAQVAAEGRQDRLQWAAVSIARRKTTVPMVVAGTHCAPFHRLPHTAAKTSSPHPRGLRATWRGEFWMCAPPARRPTPGERDPRIDLEHNVMAMR